MSERNPFQQNQKGPLQCEEWEALLVDALDGTLRAEDTAVFTAHGKDCPMCAEMLARAKQGQEWMKFLQEEPQVPADLVARILDRTSGASLPQLAIAGAAQTVPQPMAHFTTRRTFRDARMLMTAAMAFFSIALTLNLIGVRLDTLRMADLKPSKTFASYMRSNRRCANCGGMRKQSSRRNRVKTKSSKVIRRGMVIRPAAGCRRQII
jgi:hypothetical protein